MKDVDDRLAKEEKEKIGHCDHAHLENQQQDLDRVVPGYEDRVERQDWDLMCECVRCQVEQCYFIHRTFISLFSR